VPHKDPICEKSFINKMLHQNEEENRIKLVGVTVPGERENVFPS